jgi:hypothetical protein
MFCITVHTLALQPTKCHSNKFVKARNTDMRHLTTGIRSKKCVVRRFRRCTNVYLHKPT